MRPLAQFQPNIRETKWQNELNFVLLDNSFSDHFTEI